MKSRTISLVVLGILLALLLTACSSASQPPKPAPVVQPQAGSHPPVILRVEEQEEIIDGFLWFYQDIYFTDRDGDAAAMTYQEVASTFPFPINFTDDPVEASPAEQKGEVLIP